MDEISVTRSSPPSTKAIVADEGFCAQVAALLLCDRTPIHDAFIGEPAEEVLEMVRWVSRTRTTRDSTLPRCSPPGPRRGGAARGAVGPRRWRRMATEPRGWPLPGPDVDTAPRVPSRDHTGLGGEPEWAVLRCPP